MPSNRNTRRKRVRKFKAQPSEKQDENRKSLLDLPLELRNAIYAAVLQTTKPRLPLREALPVLKHPLLRVSKQTRQEFQDESRYHMIAAVRDWDFRNIVTWLNRLPNEDAEAMERKNAERKAHRKAMLKIELQFANNRVETELLKRWLNRVDVPKKRGLRLDVEYEVIAIRARRKFVEEAQWCNDWRSKLMAENFMNRFEGAPEIQKHVVKLIKALEEGSARRNEYLWWMPL